MTDDEITDMLRNAGVVEAVLPFANGSMRILRRFAQQVAENERAFCIEDVRTIGGAFAVECEELINQRSKGGI